MVAEGCFMDKDSVMEVLGKVYDPEYPLSVTELKIVERDDIEISDEGVTVHFKPTTPFCPMGGIIGVLIKYALEKALRTPVKVKVKGGSHVQEEAFNEMLNQEDRYREILKKLEDSGILKSCVSL
ncbi:MAG: iron-sulfur cluster assembly protein [Candidatus Bathyarchaeia archaeon]